MAEYRVFIAVLLLAVVPYTPSAADAPGDSKLLRTLIGRNETIRMRALESVGADRASRRKALGDLIVAANQHVEETGPNEMARPSTVALIYMIGAIDDPDSERLLIKLLDAEHRGIAMVSADALGKNKFYGAIEALKKQVDRAEYASQYGFRFNLVRSLALMEHPDAVEFLSELRTQVDGQLRHQIETLLADVTVSHFQGDQERYAKWKGAATTGAQKRDRFFKEAAFEPESLERIRLGRPQYYGIDIHAKRMLFIIDNSGSMKKYWGGVTRLERAKNELIRAITQLPPDSQFAIIFFHTSVHDWRNEMLEANEENKREAVEFVRRLGYGDRTNTYGALLRSMTFDDDLEAVFLLTDGQPTEGRITAPDGIVTDILHRNRFRHLNFNTIGIAVNVMTENFLRTLAEESNGEFRVAN